MTKTQTKYEKGEVTRLAREIYARDIQALVEPEHTGKFIVIDVETGEYDVDMDDVAASLRMRRAKPEGIRCGFRIGSGVAGFFRQTARQSV